MPTPEPTRTLVTFYSYKGGVGRSLALANVAWRLADRHGLRVLVVDWDLEAPGLHHYFKIQTEDLRSRPGVIDFFEAWKVAIEEMSPAPPDLREWSIPVTHPEAAPGHGRLSVLHAGRQDDTYARRITALDWKDLYANYEGAAAVEALREQLATTADIVLVDSRTGLSDTSGVCTMQLPDAVVMMTALNEQSFEGVTNIARTIGRQQAYRPGRPSPTLWLTLCRAFDSTDFQKWLDDHAEKFENGVEVELWSPREHPQGLSSHVLPQDARWALGEPLLARATERSPLSAALDALASKVFLWHLGDVEELTAAVRTLDEARAHLRSAEQRADELDVCVALLQVGRAHSERSEHIPALQAYVRAAGVSEAMGFVALRNLAYEGSASALRAVGEREEALSYFARALEHPDAVSRNWHAQVHRTMASIFREDRQWREALVSLEGAWEDAHFAEDRELERQALRDRVDVAIEGGLPDEGVLAFAKWLYDYGPRDGDAWALEATSALGRAWVALHAQSLDPAIESLREEISPEPLSVEPPPPPPALWFGIGSACVEAHQPMTGARLLKEALKGFEDMDDHRWVERARVALEHARAEVIDAL